MGHCLGFNRPYGLQLKTLGQDCPVFITLGQNYGDKITIPAGLESQALNRKGLFLSLKIC